MIREKTKGLPWEEAAEVRTYITGWACRTCNRFYGSGPANEQAARYCCASDAPCECGGRRRVTSVVCDDCRAKRATEKYYALEEVNWDGDTPLVPYDGDRYLFGVDDLEEYLDDCGEDGDANEESRESALHFVRLCLCRMQPPMQFDLDDLLDAHDVYIDEIFGQLRVDGQTAEKRVNDWLARLGPTWAQDNKRPTLASLRSHLGLPAVEPGKKNTQ